MNDLRPYTPLVQCEESRLEMRRQRLGHDFRDPQAPPRRHDTKPWFWRGMVFAPSVVGALFFGQLLGRWLANDGMQVTEAALTGLAMLTFLWVMLSLMTTLVGVFYRTQPARRSGQPLSLAILHPIHEESTERVEANIHAFLRDIAAQPSRHKVELFILSDTGTAEKAAEEEKMLARLCRAAPVSIHYRRRVQNVDYKSGNIEDWVSRWGGAWDAFLILDADSLMSATAIERLADELASDPSAGLIQSIPRLIRGRSLFGRLQEFSISIYGDLYLRGLSLWSGSAANYWGHNAIIRTRAFAASAGLPRLAGMPILSHDFAEAALLRRAGWSVRLLAEPLESYEECPQSLLDFCLRDRRWCRGNLQHLRLVGARGLHPVSRVHLLHGAFSYLMSPAWFCILLLWIVIGPAGARLEAAFRQGGMANPDTIIGGVVLLVVLYTALLAPKLISAMAIFLRSRAPDYGGAGMLGFGLIVAVAASVVFAPILMVQQTRSVLFAMIGARHSWTPQRRDSGRPGWSELARFHMVETALGLVLSVAILTAVTSLWLAPVAISLALAIPLSRLSSARMGALLSSPEAIAPSAFLARANALTGGIESDSKVAAPRTRPKKHMSHAG